MEPQMLKICASATVAGSILCALQAATGPPASAFDHQIELTNNTRLAIVEVYASPVGTGRWQYDLLGDDMLAPTTSMLVNIDGAEGSCRFDFKTVFDDGTNLIRRDINVCEVERYAISYR
jgi:hypothetical protein